MNLLKKLKTKFIFSTELNLKSRVEYLSRAIMCIKSVEGEGSRGVGQLLTELEEKMEVVLKV